MILLRYSEITMIINKGGCECDDHYIKNKLRGDYQINVLTNYKHLILSYDL